MKKICFTGHRNISDIHETIYNTIQILDILINQGAEDFYSGGAMGFDTIGSLAVIHMKKFHPDIKLHLVLPCSNHEQTEEWNDSYKNLFSKIISMSDSTEYIAPSYTPDCLKMRNKRLVELADGCVCYYSGLKKSGTLHTLRLAQKKGINVYNISPFIEDNANYL